MYEWMCVSLGGSARAAAKYQEKTSKRGPRADAKFPVYTSARCDAAFFLGARVWTSDDVCTASDWPREGEKTSPSPITKKINNT